MEWFKTHCVDAFWTFVIVGGVLSLILPSPYGSFLLSWFSAVLGAYIGLALIAVARVVMIKVRKWRRYSKWRSKRNYLDKNG